MADPSPTENPSPPGSWDNDDLSDLSGLSAEPGPGGLSVVLRADQRRRWLRGCRVPVEAYREQVPRLTGDRDALLDLICSEVVLREELGERPGEAEYASRFPDLAGDLARQFAVGKALAWSFLDVLRGGNAESAGPRRAGSTLADADGKWAAEAAGRRSVPGYQVLGELGRGGMGVVYKARHAALNRLVALKMVLAGGHASAGELARFRAEAEAVARLQHPGIVQVFEVGDHDGRPYLALEFCPGGSLEKKLAEATLEPRAAAGLAEALARAVQAAHEKGVVHRDLKPANVLLAEDGSPKVADFGLAKRLDSDTGQTHTGAVLGTPSYMAPEQAEGKKEVGPAADVWALGVILYECLTGRPPFKAATALETVRQVVGEEPVPPTRLQPKTPRDLETVTLKCLQKEPAKRYSSSAELADDLRRFLGGQPIAARPVPAWERGWKWARRRPAVAALVAVSLAALALLAGGGLWYGERLRSANEQLTGALGAAVANRVEADRNAAEAHDKQQAADGQRLRAEAESQRAKKVRALLAGMFTASDPVGLDSLVPGLPAGGGPPPTAREVLERAADRLRTELLDEPLVRAEALDTLGDLFRTLGAYDRAEPLLTEALALRERHLPADDLDLAATLHHLGALWRDRGEFDRAEPLYRRALAVREGRLPPDDPAVTDTLFHLGMLFSYADDLGEAERLFTDVLERRRRRLGDGHHDTAIARMGLVEVYLERGDVARAIPLAAQVYKEVQARAAGTDMGVVVARLQQAIAAQLADRPRDAVGPLRECLKAIEQRLGRQHIYTVVVRFQLALALDQSGQGEEAERAFRDCATDGRATAGMGHAKACVLVQAFGDLLRRRGKAAEAEALFQELIEIHRRRGNGRFAADALLGYGDFLGYLDRPAEKLAALRESVELFRRTGGPKRKQFVRALDELAGALRRQGKPAEAEPLLAEALPLARKQFGDRHANTAEVLNTLAGVRLEQGKTAGVEAMLIEARDILRPTGPLAGLGLPGLTLLKPAAPPLALSDTLRELNRYYRTVGKPAEAAAVALERRQGWPDNSLHVYWSACDLAFCGPVVGRGKPSLTEAERAERRKYEDLALETLRRAVAKGFADANRLRDDAAWSALRDRAEFRLALTEVAERAKRVNRE
jgi:tetratricopeptide (TPR) repeat protein